MQRNAHETAAATVLTASSIEFGYLGEGLANESPGKPLEQGQFLFRHLGGGLGIPLLELLDLAVKDALFLFDGLEDPLEA